MARGACVAGGCACLGGVCVPGDMAGGCACPGVCVVGACVAGGMHGWGHACLGGMRAQGGMHGRWEVRGWGERAWLGGVHAMHAPPA